MKKPHNFYPGPGALPASVLATVERELRSYQRSGMSIMEFSHRSAAVTELIDDTLERLRRLLCLDEQWELILLQGGGSLQFLMVPYNLSRPHERIDYIDTGYWTQRAIKEALCCRRDLQVIADSAAADYHELPVLEKDVHSTDARYLHICTNNTVVGTQWHQLPDVDTPLVLDASSDFLARELDLSGVHLLYAHAQKNIGLAGVTVVAVRKASILPDDSLPAMLSYQAHIDKTSNYHTPPVFAIYVTNLMLKWLEHEMGGLNTIAALNREKARRLYAAVDQSAVFHCPVKPADRSRMNVIFSSGDDIIDQQFIVDCAEHNIIGIAGHRSRKGLRASLYNAVSPEDVEALIERIAVWSSGKFH